jgi:hypothetical protein
MHGYPQGMGPPGYWPPQMQHMPGHLPPPGPYYLQVPPQHHAYGAQKMEVYQVIVKLLSFIFGKF